MKSAILTNFKNAIHITWLTKNLPFATAIAAFVTCSALPQSAFAADTWGYCAIIDNNGRLARFTNIFHYPFLVTKFDLKPSAERFKSDTNSSYRAAADCLIYDNESSAIKQREMNVEAMHGIGAHVELTGYNVKYKNYPSTPPPKLVSNPADQLPQSNGGSSTTPHAVNEQPRVTIQNNNRVQLPSNNNSSNQSVTQMKPHTRQSTQDAIAQAQQKTHRIKLAEAKRERERQRLEREKRAREKRAREKAEREKIVHNVVLTWQNKAGKWFACGPVQCIWAAEDTEQKAIGYVLGAPRHSIVGTSRYYGCRQYTVAAKAKDTAGDDSEASIRRRAKCQIGKIGN